MRLEAEVTELSVCDVCQKSYGNPSQLSQHFKLSHSNESFVCECGKQFSRADLLQMHQVIHKTQKKVFDCEHCPKKFARKGALKNHVLLHMNDKLISCDSCPKQFRNKPGLKSHMKTHTREGRHHCFECGKTFTHLNSFKSHKNRHTGKKIFDCSSY